MPPIGHHTLRPLRIPTEPILLKVMEIHSIESFISLCCFPSLWEIRWREPHTVPSGAATAIQLQQQPLTVAVITF